MSHDRNVFCGRRVVPMVMIILTARVCAPAQAAGEPACHVTPPVLTFDAQAGKIQSATITFTNTGDGVLNGSYETGNLGDFTVTGAGAFALFPKQSHVAIVTYTFTGCGGGVQRGVVRASCGDIPVEARTLDHPVGCESVGTLDLGAVPVGEAKAVTFIVSRNDCDPARPSTTDFARFATPEFSFAPDRVALSGGESRASVTVTYSPADGGADTVSVTLDGWTCESGTVVITGKAASDGGGPGQPGVPTRADLPSPVDPSGTSPGDVWSYAWTAPAAGEPVDKYAVEIFMNGAVMDTVYVVGSTQFVLDAGFGNDYSVRVAGIDAENNWGPWSEASILETCETPAPSY